MVCLRLSYCTSYSSTLCVCPLQRGLIESLYVATLQRPWLWAVYVFTVGLPVILFISFMWPDKVNLISQRMFGKHRSAAVKEVTWDCLHAEVWAP